MNNKEYIRAVVAAAPELTPEQRDRVSVLLNGPFERAVAEYVAAEADEKAVEAVLRERHVQSIRRVVQRIESCAACGGLPFMHTPTGHDYQPIEFDVAAQIIAEERDKLYGPL